MEIEDKRFLVAGASGDLGGRLARALGAAGARLALAGRDAGRLEGIAAELAAPALPLEVTDPGSCVAAVESAREALGGLDGIVVATGVVAFGDAGELSSQVEETLIEVNAIGPMALIAAAIPRLERPGAVVALSAVVAEFPIAGLAAYSASKSALSAYLAAVRRERRRELTVLDVRPGHMETGFADRALAGEPPKMPEPQDPDQLVARVLEALAADRRTLAFDPREQVLKES